MKRIFIYQDPKSAKFWSIDVQTTSFEINFGKVGATGQTKVKIFTTQDECQKQADKLIKEKFKKGYIESNELVPLSSTNSNDKCNKLDIENLSQLQVEKILNDINQGLLKFNSNKSGSDYYNQLYPAKMDERDLSDYVSRYPKLTPLMVKVLESLLFFMSKVGNVWVTDEEQAGSSLSYSLAMNNKQYCSLFAQILEKQDLYHEVNQNSYIDSIINKWGLCSEVATILKARQDNAGQHGLEFIEALQDHYGKELKKWIELDDFYSDENDEEDVATNGRLESNNLTIEDRERQKKLKAIFNKVLVSFSSTNIKWYNAVERAYGKYHFKDLLDEDMPVLFECIDKMTTKKVRYETMLYHTYFILQNIKPLSFEKVKKMVESIKIDGIYPDPKTLYDENEKDNKIRIDVVANLNDKKDIKKLLTDLLNDIDNYIQCKQLDRVWYRIDPPKNTRGIGATEEDGLLTKAAKYPEFHSTIEIILQKIVTANGTYPLFDENKINNDIRRHYIGTGAIAYLTAQNSAKYDFLLLNYLQGIQAHSEEYLLSLFLSIQRCWSTNDNYWAPCKKEDIPTLPLTFKSFPELFKPID